MADDTKLGDEKEKAHIAYLYAWPLIGKVGGGIRVIEKLDFDSEKQVLFNTLTEVNKQYRLRMQHATSDNLMQAVILGCRALHYTGHGLPGCLAFEDDEGKMHGVTSKSLADIITAARGRDRVKLVVVSACHSKPCGEAFVQAGIPHVVAVRLDAQVADKAAQNFMQQFYTSLLMGGTVQEAFDVAVTALKYGATTGRGENLKFMLLPEGGDHNKKIFGDIPSGHWTDVSPPVVPHNLLALPDYFTGRNVELQQLVSLLNNKAQHRRRLITVTGPNGMGKTTLAMAAARYVCERRMFEGVYCVSFADLQLDPDTQQLKSLATVFSQELQLDPVCKDNASLARALGNKNYLIVLDGVDALLSEELGERLCVRYLIKELLQRNDRLRLIVTSEEKLGGDLQEFVVWQDGLGPLAPQAAAQMFYNVAPRRIPPEEFGCQDPTNGLQDLAKHDALIKIEGHPRLIVMTAQLLTGKKMNDLPPLIDQLRKDAKDLKLRRIDMFRKLADEIQPFPGPHLGPRFNDKELQLEKELERLVPNEVGRQLWRQFQGAMSVSWEEFSPALQRHFLQVTGAHDRPLSGKDMVTIKARLEKDNGSSDIITLEGFARFWSFFGVLEWCILQIRDVWQRSNPRIIHGLMSRAEAATSIEGHTEGTFILRFSESNPGYLAVAYVADNKQIQHVLIEIQENSTFVIHLPNKRDVSYNSLETLLMKCKPLRILYPGNSKEQVFQSQQPPEGEVPD